MDLCLLHKQVYLELGQTLSLGTRQRVHLVVCLGGGDGCGKCGLGVCGAGQLGRVQGDCLGLACGFTGLQHTARHTLSAIQITAMRSSAAARHS